MIGKIRRILGLETNDEKLARFNETNNSIAELSRKIDNIAEEFTIKNESFKSLLKSGSLDQQVKQNIQKRYDNFLNYHKQELQPIVKQRRELRKQHEAFMKDSSLFKAIRDINIIGTAKEKYLSGDINQNQFDIIIKARQGKVKYSDIILFNEEGRFLILQRSNEEADKLANMWGVPGGHVDAGEEFYDAAVRELWEESGITCKELEEIGIYEDQNVEIHYFIGNVSSKEIMTAIQAGEAQDLKWIHVENIPDYKMPFNMADNLLKFIKEESDSGYWDKLETALKQGKIEKSFYDELLLKARSGVYKDTPQNRKLGVVGQKYGSTKTEEEKQEKYKDFASERDEKLRISLLDHYSKGRWIRAGATAAGMKYLRMGAITLRLADHSAKETLQDKNQVSIVVNEFDPTKQKFISDNTSIFNVSKKVAISRIDNLLKGKLLEYSKEPVNDIDDFEKYLETMEAINDNTNIKEKELKIVADILSEKSLKIKEEDKEKFDELIEEYGHLLPDDFSMKNIEIEKNKEEVKEELKEINFSDIKTGNKIKTGNFLIEIENKSETNLKVTIKKKNSYLSEDYEIKDSIDQDVNDWLNNRYGKINPLASYFNEKVLRRFNINKIFNSDIVKSLDIKNNIDSLEEELLFKSKAKDKFSLVMKEFSEGKLKSSSGEKVVDRDQALAIAYSESGLEKDIEKLEKNNKIKIIDFFGKRDDGATTLGIELHHKRMTNFIPFELEDYQNVMAFIDEKYPELFGLKRLEMIDKLLFPTPTTDILSEFNKWKETYTEITKSVDLLEYYYLNDIISEDIFEKARTGVYQDNSQNRSLKRVGKKYSKDKQGSEKVDFVMGEFKEGRLKDRNGSVVTDRKQAMAIALSEAGLSNGEEEVEDEEEDSEVKKSINTIIKALETGKLQFDLIKAQVHKYIRREGSKGNYKYIYEEPKQETLKGEEMPEILESKLEEIKGNLIKYKDDTELGSKVKEVLSKLNDGEIKEAIVKFRESELHYQLGNTYDSLKRFYADLDIHNKYGLDWGTIPGKYEVWRSGEVGGQKNGIFFSINKDGAEAYSDNNSEGRSVNKYEVNIQNPLVVKRAEYAYSILSGKSMQSILSERDKSKDVGNWWIDLDKKVAKLAKGRGYDSITYTAPAPPAIRELVLLDPSSVTKKDDDVKKSLDLLESAYEQGLISFEILEKARTGKYADTAENRKLKRVGQEYGSKKQEEQTVDKQKKDEETKIDKPASIEDQAKQASQTALENAAKGGNEELRVAAHKEIQRREQEEKPKEGKEEDNKGTESNPIDEVNTKIEEELNKKEESVDDLNEDEIRKKIKDLDLKLEKANERLKDKLEGLSFLQKAKAKSEDKEYSSLIALKKELTDKLIELVDSKKESDKKQKESEDLSKISDHKKKQFEIIQETNPMLDDYHVGIRSPKDIKSFEETINDDESFSWGDFSKEDAKKALRKGEITLYSSKPIKQGGFVSTSKSQAEQYAGGAGKKVYSKKVKLEDVAWINGDEGQYAELDNKEIEKSEKIDGGLADNRSIEDIAKKHGVSVSKIIKELNKGIDIEKEHTDDEEKATEIAKDHLMEISDYYTRLEKMEKQAKND